MPTFWATHTRFLIHDPRESILPIFIVNPARKPRAAKKRTPVKGSIKRVPISSKGAKKPLKKKTAARKTAITNPKQGKKKMAKKLYGAAAAARKKRLAKAKRARGRKGNPAKKRKSAKRVAAGKKAAATRKRKARAKAYHSGASAYSAGIAKRKKRKPAKRKTTTKRKTKRSKASYQAAARKAARTRKRNLLAKRRPSKKLTAAQKRRRSSYGLKGMRKARKRVLRAKRRPAARRTQAYMRKHNMMKVNPSNGMMSAVKQVLPIAGSFYVSKLVSNKLHDLPAVSGVTSKLTVGGYALGKPVLSGAIMAAAHYGSKKGALAKHRTGLMLGTALAFVDSLISTFAPPEVKAVMGVGGYGSLGEYVAAGEYVPTSEYVAAGDYVATSGYEEHAYGTSIGGYPGADEDPHGLYAVADIDSELGAIEAGIDTGNHSGIFSNSW
jgi:colicin import membrane protein